MLNRYSFKDNEILICAPGSSDTNRIKNDLIWDVNSLLADRFKLYTFFVSKKPSDAPFCRRVSDFPPKYISFQKLDDMFVKRRTLSDGEINRYREIMDPSRKMSDDVFGEACCMENVDIEYVAAESFDRLLNANMTSKSKMPLHRWIASLFPVYVSLFGSKEMRIVINRSDLLEPIMAIVTKHCEENAY